MATTTSLRREPTRSNISERRAKIQSLVVKDLPEITEDSKTLPKSDSLASPPPEAHEVKQRSQRDDFNRHIRQAINDQAEKAATRRKVSDHEKPNPIPTRAACRNSSTEPIKGKTHEAQGQRVSEFRTVREKDAIFRLLSREGKDSEPHAGKQCRKLGGSTEFG